MILRIIFGMIIFIPTFCFAENQANLPKYTPVTCVDFANKILGEADFGKIKHLSSAKAFLPYTFTEDADTRAPIFTLAEQAEPTSRVVASMGEFEPRDVMLREYSSRATRAIRLEQPLWNISFVKMPYDRETYARYVFTVKGNECQIEYVEKDGIKLDYRLCQALITNADDKYIHDLTLTNIDQKQRERLSKICDVNLKYYSGLKVQQADQTDSPSSVKRDTTR